MHVARIIVACVALVSVLFGAALVALDVSGVLEWSGRAAGASFDVKSSHVGIAFALVGMTVAIFVIKNPSKREEVTKRKVTYSHNPHPRSRHTGESRGPDLRSERLGELTATEENECITKASSAGSAAEPTEDGAEKMLAEVLGKWGVPESQRPVIMRQLREASNFLRIWKVLDELVAESGVPETERLAMTMELLEASMSTGYFQWIEDHSTIVKSSPTGGMYH